MRRRGGGWRAFKRQDQAAAVVEFALVVPIFFLLVWGGLSFSRAYQRLNILTGALREGARYGATLNATAMGSLQDSVRARVDRYSNAFGFSDLDQTQVTAVLDVPSSEVRVSVTSFPLFSNLTGFGLLSTITVSRMAIFRCERAPSC